MTPERVGQSKPVDFRSNPLFNDPVSLTRWRGGRGPGPVGVTAGRKR